MEIKNIQGKNYLFDKVKVDDMYISIIAKISETNPTMVEFKSFKPNQNSNFPAELGMMCPINEYLDEIKMMCAYLNENGISGENFLKSFINLLDKHIKEIGRLIDTDLYSYIDKAIILQNSIATSYGDEVSNEQASNSWVKLLKFSIEKYKEYIYLNQYDMSNPMFPKPILIKLTDLQN